jgi:hypothetical protein
VNRICTNLAKFSRGEKLATLATLGHSLLISGYKQSRIVQYIQRTLYNLVKTYMENSIDLCYNIINWGVISNDKDKT